MSSTPRQYLRLRNYDYRRPGAYFLTMVTANRRHIFGRIRGGRMLLSPEGMVAAAVWESIPTHHPGVDLDAMVVMPDHLHGILVIQYSPLTLMQLVALYKGATTRDINRLRATPGGAVWQRSFYERVNRNEGEWRRLRRYIEDNPRRWEEQS